VTEAATLPKATIVVPCHNEADRLHLTAFSTFLMQTSRVRFVFVDDGSDDDTPGRLATLQGAHPDQVEVLSISRTVGKAEAVRRGLVQAIAGGAEFVGYWDADLSTPLATVLDLLHIGQRFTEVEVVYATRLRLFGRRIARSLTRRLIAKACTRLERAVVGLPVGDTRRSAKLLRNTPRLTRILAKPFSSARLFDVELLSRLAENRGEKSRALYELPLVEWTAAPRANTAGQASIREGIALLRLLAERRLGLSIPTALTNLADFVVSHSIALRARKAACDGHTPASR
jgi:glycosyltransferase involved in cell wall biosynthesis